MKKRILTIALVIALLATCFAGTYAYLTDKDAATNTMTLGNVVIEQHEYQRVMDKNGKFVEGVAGTDFKPDYGIEKSYKLEAFEQNKPAYPVVGGEAYDEFQQLWNQVGAPGSNEIFSMPNVVDKFVFVENTGKTDVYFRTIVLIEAPEAVASNMIHVNTNGNARYSYSSNGTAPGEAAEGFEPDYVVINGTRYMVYVATHTEILKGKNEDGTTNVARPSLLQVHLDHMSTNADSAAFGETWEILTLSQAVQAAGFENAWAALNEAFGNVTAENLQTWFAKQQ